MTRSLRKYILTTILSFVIIYAHALDTYTLEGEAFDAGAYYNYNSISAQVADMFRYGEFQTSLFTGRLQVSIPVYELDDPDFKMNIALHYNAEGFKPRKHSGYVGYNWFLEAGGCITREVKGYPDEIYGYRAGYQPGESGAGVEGMYHFITMNANSNNWNKSDVFELPLAADSQACQTSMYLWHNVGDSCIYQVDYMPDIFHFNFCGHEGTFIIDNEGDVQIISGDFVKVDLSETLTNWDPQLPFPASATGHGVPMYPMSNSTITITTTDGYRYVFGGDLSKLEYTINAYSRDQFMPVDIANYNNQEQNPPTVTTWYLAQVIAPNQRTMTYYYKPANNSYWDFLLGDLPSEEDPLWEFNETFDKFGWYYQKEVGIHDMIVANHNEHVTYSPYTEEEYNCLRTFYTPPYFYIGGSYYTFSATKTCILDSIHISGEQPLHIIFRNSQESMPMYDESAYKLNSKRNYQLDSICVLSSGRIIKTASLSYSNKSSSSTHPFHWRLLDAIYVSGAGNFQMNYNDGYYPDLYLSSTSYPNNYNHVTGESHETDDYGYYVGNYNIALLQKMTYPTGGFQTYTYEPYYFDKKRKYSIAADSIVEMHTVNEVGQKKGVRIKDVRTYEKEGNLIEQKSYTYSYGIYYDNQKVYNLTEYMYPEYGWPVRYNANYGLLDTHIGYGKVEEFVTNTQGSFKTTYHFDMGDNTYTSLNDSNLIGRYYCDDCRFGVTEGQLLLYGSKLNKWGKITSIEYFDSGNRLLKSKHYAYNDLSLPSDSISGIFLGCIDTIVVYSSFYGAEISKKLYLYPDVMTKEVVRDYSQGDSLITTRVYSYDRKLRVTKETIDDSQGIQHFTRYTYPDNLSIPYPYPIFQLQRMNCIGHPIETFSGYIKDDIEYVTNGVVEEYNNINYISHGGHRFHPYLYKTLSLALTEPITDYQPMSNSGPLITYDSHYKLDCEYHFNLQNRLTFIQPVGQLPTTYTWNGIYPVTKTTGNQTYTYTFIPHVGISSITDPRGITTYYSYDEHGRLVESYQLVNDHKQIINAYQYHVKTENL